MTINYIIVDDEHIAHDIIRQYCDMLPSMNLLQDCYDAIEALEFLNTDARVDLIFLDLNMPKLKGFQFLRTLANPPKIIVTTAYKEYALEGYELAIVDYLLKPFPFERLLKAVNKAFPQPAGNISAQLPQEEEAKRIFLRANKRHIQVAVHDILYVEASGNYTKVILQEETITTREKITSLMSMLPSHDFLQVHRSFMVGLKHIRSIEGNQIFIKEHAIPIGSSYKENVLNLLA